MWFVWPVTINQLFEFQYHFMDIYSELLTINPQRDNAQHLQAILNKGIWGNHGLLKDVPEVEKGAKFSVNNCLQIMHSVLILIIIF